MPQITPLSLAISAGILLYSLVLGADEKTSFGLSSTVLQNQEVEFLQHTAPRPFGSYLTMNIRYQPVKELFEQLQNATGKRLKNRGEAHITVITPPEYDQVLKKHLSIERIHQIAQEAEIQSSSFEVLCLGRGQVSLRNALEQTYYVVIQSPALQRIRELVHQEYLSAGGSPGAFDPENFYPHVTLGFSQRDLHLSDGVIKDRSSCYAEIEVVSL